MKKRRLLMVLLLLAVSILSTLFAVGCGKKKDKDITCTVIVHNAQGEEVKTYTFDRSEGNRIEYRPSKEGHYFNGWVLNVTADTDDFYFNAYGSQVSNKSLSEGRINLYPVFVPYMYKFNLHSGDEGTFGYNSNKNTYYYRYEDGKPMDLLTVPTPNDSKASFVGYYSSSFNTQYTDETGKILDGMLDKPQQREEGSLVFDLYAKYGKRTVTITLDYDGRIKNREVKVDYDLPFSELDLSEYEKTDGNKEVTGWEMPNGEEFPDVLIENITLKAVWTSFRDLDFYYTENDARTQRVYINDEGKYVLPTPDDSARKGYRFKGWYQNAECTGAVLVNATLSQNYYAKWQMAEYEVNFVCDNGETFEKKTYFYGDEIELPTPTAIKTGYKFGGWTETENGEGGFFKITSDMYGDKTLYPKWNPETYTVTFNTGYGLLEKTADSVRFEQEYSLPVPQRTGYSFQGWYSTETGDGVRFTDPEGNCIKVWSETQGAELYARYVRKTYNVTYESNGGTAVSAQRYSHGERFDFPESPTRAGYTFWGWYDEPIINEYTEKETVRENVTLYARWLEESVAISDADGLKAIKNNPSGTYHLTKDINLMGEAWSPIPEFSGKLNGNGHKIFNFSMSETARGSQNFGFFRKNSGLIENIIISQAAVNFSTAVYDSTADFIAGILVGTNVSSGKIRNCSVQDTEFKVHFHGQADGEKGQETTMNVAGGLIGANNNEGVVEYCSSSAVITASMYSFTARTEAKVTNGIYVGGISGSATASSVMIKNCVFSGNITVNVNIAGKYSDVDSVHYVHSGGIVPINNGICKNNVFLGSISVSSVETWTKGLWTPYVWNDCYVGGITSENYPTGVIQGCVSSGTLTGSAPRIIRMGGITGKNHNGGKITDCYSSINVNANAGSDRISGGFVAENAGTIKTSYFTGKASGGTSGAFVGANGGTGMIMNSFSTSTQGSFVGTNGGSVSGCAVKGDKKTESNSVATYTESELFALNTIFNKFYFTPETWIVSEDGVKLYWEAWE